MRPVSRRPAHARICRVICNATRFPWSWICNPARQGCPSGDVSSQASGLLWQGWPTIPPCTNMSPNVGFGALRRAPRVGHCAALLLALSPKPRFEPEISFFSSQCPRKEWRTATVQTASRKAGFGCRDTDHHPQSKRRLLHAHAWLRATSREPWRSTVAVPPELSKPALCNPSQLRHLSGVEPGQLPTFCRFQQARLVAKPG